jgi:hypothetical protein
MEPPPLWTCTVHTPQEPLPPQAEGMKIFWLARVLSSVLPAGAMIGLARSPFTMILTSAMLTSFLRAPSSSATRKSTISRKKITP